MKSRQILIIGCAVGAALGFVAPAVADDQPRRANDDPRAALVDFGDAAAVDAAIQTRLGLAEADVRAVEFDPAPGTSQVIEVEIGGAVRRLEVAPYSVRAPGYKVIHQIEGGTYVQVPPRPIRTVRGTVQDQPGTIVAGAVHEDGVHLLVHGLGESVWCVDGIAPYLDGADTGLHVIYRSTDVVRDGTCGLVAEAGDVPQQAGGVAGQNTVGVDVADFGAEADFPFFDRWGGQTEDRVNLLMNAVSTQYITQTQIHHNITAIVIRTSEQDDPYPTGAEVDADDLLDAFRSEWLSNQGGIPRDLAILFSGREFLGTTIGLAWIGGLCSTLEFGVTEQDDVLACHADTIAHEMGHLWNAPHCNCPQNTMNASSGGSCGLLFTNQSISFISSFANSHQFCLGDAQAPINPSCATAIPVGNGSFSFSTNNATTNGFSESLCAVDAGDAQVGSDIWYRYDAECSDTVSFDVCSASFNSKIALYQSFCPQFAEAAIACADDTCGQGASITHNVQAGVTYLLRIGGFEGAQGTGTLLIDAPICVDPPPNDDCGAASFIVAGTHPLTTAGATTDGPDDASCPIQRDIWYRVGNTCDEYLSLTICDADFDTSIAVYGSDCPGAGAIATSCNDDACGTGSSVFFPATSGSLYRVRVGSPTGTTGTGTLMVACSDSSDCNSNAIPDSTDLADETSFDCNSNGVPDECDIANDVSDDENGNGVPDECDPPDCPTDTDGNGATDVDDLVAVIIDWGTDGAANSTDVDGSGVVDVDDLVEIILSWGPC